MVRNLDRKCRFFSQKLSNFSPGQTVLDLGCGWGSVALFVAEHYPKSSVLALSNSSTQKDYIMSQAKSKGLKNLNVFTGDVAVFQREDWIQKFDRVISIGDILFLHIFI